MVGKESLNLEMTLAKMSTPRDRPSCSLVYMNDRLVSSSKVSNVYTYAAKMNPCIIANCNPVVTGLQLAKKQNSSNFTLRRRPCASMASHSTLS